MENIEFNELLFIADKLDNKTLSNFSNCSKFCYNVLHPEHSNRIEKNRKEYKETFFEIVFHLINKPYETETYVKLFLKYFFHVVIMKEGEDQFIDNDDEGEELFSDIDVRKLFTLISPIELLSKMKDFIKAGKMEYYVNFLRKVLGEDEEGMYINLYPIYTTLDPFSYDEKDDYEMVKFFLDLGNWIPPIWLYYNEDFDSYMKKVSSSNKYKKILFSPPNKTITTSKTDEEIEAFKLKYY